MLPLVTIISLLLIFFFLRSKVALTLLSIPALNVSYFIVSTRIFNFGTILPYTYYDKSKDPYYDIIMYAMIAHFLCIFFAFKFMSRFDSSQYQFQRLSLSFLRPSVFRRMLGWPFAIVCIFPAIIIFLASDPASLLSRNGFIIDFPRRQIMIFEPIFFLFSVILTPFLRSRIQRFFVLMTCVLFYLMIGSRSGPTLLIFYVIIERFVIGHKNLKTQVSLFLLAVYLLTLSLSARLVNLGGLIPIINHAKEINLGILSSAAIFSFNYILNYSVVINGEMLARGSSIINVINEWFYYSILPIPSFIFNRTEAFDAVNRFRVNIPYPGFGYALLYLGFPGYLLVVFMSSSLFFGMRAIFSKRRDSIELILFYSIMFLPFLFFLQYNLRTGSRFLYFLVIIYFLVALGRRLRFKSRA